MGGDVFPRQVRDLCGGGHSPANWHLSPLEQKHTCSRWPEPGPLREEQPILGGVGAPLTAKSSP
eukprot:9482279-Pyramimonas_sp.AAC.1